MTSTTVDIKSVLELVCISAAYDTCFRAAILHTPSRYWQPAGYSVRISNKKNQHFRPCRKNYALDRKMTPTFLDGLLDALIYHHAKLGRSDQTTRAGCRCENMVFKFVTLWSACAWFEQVLCNGLWVDFDAVFIVFFPEEIAL